MSELIAEARVLVTPDTTTFRALLTTQLAAATKGVTVPVSVTPVASGATGAVGAATASAVRQQIAGATAAEAKIAALNEKFAAQRVTAETKAAGLRIASREREVAALLAAERAGVKQQEALAAQRVTAETAASSARIAAKEREVAALLAADLKQQQSAVRAAAVSSAAATAAQARSLSGLSSGAASAGLALAGLRGATLAANAPFLAGAAAAISLSKAIKLATSFNSEIAVLGATTGATGVQLEQAAEAARAFGRDITLPGVTAGDAAKTITEFSKAGLDLNESIAATRGGLQLAQAAQLSYTDAVTLTANALNAFGLSGNQAVRVADTLANASNLAQGGIEDTALALRQAATAAEAVGVSFEDTTALLTLLAKNGLTGSDAGTALRTAFLRLVNPSKAANTILEDLNVNLRDIQGNVRPEVFAEFAEAQADLSVKTQQANAAIVFGQDAFRAYAVLAQEGTKGLTDVQAALGETGTAARIAGARMTGLAGAQENLSNQLSSLGETIGQFATPPLTAFVDELARYVGLTGTVIGSADQVAAAFGRVAEELPGGKGDSPIDFGFGDAFRAGVAGVQNLNPQVAEIFKFIEVLNQQEEDARDEIKNGGVELRDALETAGREAARGAVGFAEQITGAIDAAFNAVRDAIARGQRAARAGIIAGIGRAGGQAAGLEEGFDAILAGGGSRQQQIANLREQAKVQARIIEQAGPNAAGVVLEARRKAQARLAQINQQITAIEESIASDQKAAQDEQDRIREDAKRDRDRAFLDAQEGARARQQNQVALAEQTKGVADDIRENTELRALLQAQIRQIKNSSLDQQAKREAIRALTAATIATTGTIKGLEQTQKEQAEAERKQREANRQAIHDQTAENAALRTQIAEARDAPKSVIVQFIDAQIAIARAALARAKAAGKGILAAKAELEEFRRKKRELLEEAEEDEGGGTTLVDLFNRAQEIAGGAGNVGQTATGLRNIPANVRIKTEVQERLEIVNDPAARQAAQQKQATDSLISAIQDLTAAITGGNGTTGGRAAGRNVDAWKALSSEQRFFFQKQAKAMVDHGLAGRGGI